MFKAVARRLREVHHLGSTFRSHRFRNIGSFRSKGRNNFQSIAAIMLLAQPICSQVPFLVIFWMRRKHLVTVLLVRCVLSKGLLLLRKELRREAAPRRYTPMLPVRLRLLRALLPPPTCIARRHHQLLAQCPNVSTLAMYRVTLPALLLVRACTES